MSHAWHRPELVGTVSQQPGALLTGYCVLCLCRVSDLYHSRNELLDELKESDPAAAKGEL